MSGAAPSTRTPVTRGNGGPGIGSRTRHGSSEIVQLMARRKRVRMKFGTGAGSAGMKVDRHLGHASGSASS